MRRKELIGLGLFDIDAERGTVHIREGKGGRGRIVPIDERARLWIDIYVSDARPELLVPPRRRRAVSDTLWRTF
jgi:integrase/recombinase XerD